jgi:HD-GYP domain-containing protein (c-di-GMP phosphodiesterase class II)
VCETKLGPVPDGALERVTITDFVDELVAALLTRRLYNRSHTRVRGRIAELKVLHRRLIEASKHPSLVLGTIEGFLLYDDRPLLGASMGAKALIDRLVARNAGGIEFARTTGEQDFELLLELLAGPVQESTHELSTQRLRREGCLGISLLPPYRRERAASSGEIRVPAGLAADLDRSGLRLPMQKRQRVVHSLQEASISAASGHNIDLQDIHTMAEMLSDGVRRNAAEVQDIVRYERFDAYTFGHSVRVCAIAAGFASELTSDAQLVQRIGTAALLHDIGKAGIASEVLHHRGRLSPEQRREMERHTELGSAILLEQDGIDDVAVIVSHGHHRNLDGSGYPSDGLKLEHSMVTRLVRICDVYEALTAPRPYKGAMSPTKAFRVMLDSPGAFDPGLLRRFIASTGCYPVGCEVELSDRTVARVLQQTKSLARPVVQLVRTEAGENLHEVDRRTIDLSLAAPGELAVSRLLEGRSLQVELRAVGEGPGTREAA